MIRIILFRVDGQGDWNEGVLHTFNDCMAVVEIKATGELLMVPVKPENLKFQLVTEKWVALQMEAQRQQQAHSVMAVPPGRIVR